MIESPSLLQIYSISPFHGSYIPHNNFNRVVFPEPLGPTIDANRPLGIVKLTPSITKL